MSGISTHVLDLACGRPAAGIDVRLERKVDGQWRAVAAGTTDTDGRVTNLLAAGPPLLPGAWRLHFDLAPYFAAQATEGFFPEALLTFDVRDANRHHHVPLLLSPHGFTTYRGS